MKCCDYPLEVRFRLPRHDRLLLSFGQKALLFGDCFRQQDAESGFKTLSDAWGFSRMAGWQAYRKGYLKQLKAQC
jgi:hypothetical protein